MSIIDGKKIAANIKEDIKLYVKKRMEQGKRIPQIASILVGDDPGSIYYINAQEKVATSLGVKFNKILLEDDISEAEIEKIIISLNEDEDTQGIMLQLPLPKHLNEKKITSLISYKKDIDCLSNETMGRFYKGENGFIPCTPRSIITLLKSLDVELEGKNAVVLGRSNIVGKPVFQLLLNENATVTVCHSRTKNLKDICKNADILVAAIGKPKYITKEFVKDGAIVIDVGTSSLNGKICGDVDFEDVKEVASYITPVPGGVGALTTTLLVKNACEALEKNENKNINS